MIPDTSEDVSKTIALKDEIVNNSYDRSKYEIKCRQESLMSNSATTKKPSYASVLKTANELDVCVKRVSPSNSTSFVQTVSKEIISGETILIESKNSHPQKKLKDMTPDERKEYNRQRQKNKRERDSSLARTKMDRLSKNLATISIQQSQMSGIKDIDVGSSQSNVTKKRPMQVLLKVAAKSVFLHKQVLLAHRTKRLKT